MASKQLFGRCGFTEGKCHLPHPTCISCRCQNFNKIILCDVCFKWDDHHWKVYDMTHTHLAAWHKRKHKTLNPFGTRCLAHF